MNRLPDISAVEPLGEKDKLLMDACCRASQEHNALGGFRVTLLHQHFDISDEEVLVEATDIASRTQTIVPMSLLRARMTTQAPAPNVGARSGRKCERGTR